MYYLWAALLFLSLSGSAFLTLLGLPGNWLMVFFVALFAYFFPPMGALGISWTLVFVMAGLALLGEILEFSLGAVGMAKGGSKKGAWYAVIGSFVGSFAGAAIFSVVPVVGTIIGLVLGASVGAMTGAVVAERSLGKSDAESLRLGQIAFWGRLWGSVGKFLIGAILMAMGTAATLL